MNEHGSQTSVAPQSMELIRDYLPPPGVHDELLRDVATPRPYWRLFCQLVSALGPVEFSRRWTQAQRLVRENGIAFSAFGDPSDKPRPWELDPFPILIEGQEWCRVTEALRQRARLFDLILRDLYGPQTLLKRGVLPPSVLFNHPGFEHPFHGQTPAEETFLYCYAADLARAPDGKWWVLGDRTEAPSGMGYALENRIIISRMLPQIFRHCQVKRLASYFIALQEMLHGLAPQHHDNPRVAILSQGPQSANYFEDAYLARYLGYTLVEGEDLAIRNNRVLLKTLGGLRPLDVILRRPNSDHCDPLEVRGAFRMGPPGLLQAARTRSVSIANRLGSGLVESPVFMAFLPQLCQEMLGEQLKIPGIATWWCGDQESRDYVLSNLERLTVKSAYRRRGQERATTQDLGQMSIEQLAVAIQVNPTAYVAQETIPRSSAPVWKDQALHSSYAALRAYLVASGDSYTVMNGGLARISTTLESLDVSLLAGEGSKDVWVLSQQPVEHVSLLQRLDEPVQLLRIGAELPSRVADDIFWLGRYIERVDAAARLLRTVMLRLTSEAEPASLTELPVLLRTMALQGQIEPGFVVDGIKEQLPSIDQILPTSVFDEEEEGSLRSTVDHMFRLASRVRDRMSVDCWRIVHRIDQQFCPPSYGTFDLTYLLNMTNEMIIDLSAFGGMVMESMTRAQAFRFLDLGRRLERALQIIDLLKVCFVETEQVTGDFLEAVLEVEDSMMTYRSRYLANLQMAAVLDLVLTDESNPRSVAYQLVAIARHVENLPRDQAQPGYALEQRLAMSLLHVVRMVDIQETCRQHVLDDTRVLGNILASIEKLLPELSDAISHRYLVHATPSQQLSEIRPESP